MIMKTFENYQILETLGEGTFGKVKLASFNNQLYAIKFATQSQAYSNEVLEQIFNKQSCILKDLNHEHIIKLHAIIQNGIYHKNEKQETRSGLVFDYAPYSLADMLAFGPLPQTVCRTLFRQLIDGIYYLHERNIIHRDIKPQNILFDTHFSIKICDFGLSTKVINDTKPKTLCGSDAFKSPELLLKKNYNGVMNDLFAAAVTLFILMTGHAPFNSAHPDVGHYKFIALNYTDKFWQAHQKAKKNLKLSSDFKNLINSMLAFDPTHRLTMSEIICHPWMNGDIMMGNQVEDQMRKIENEIIQKKRKSILKNMKQKMPHKLEMNANRSITNCIDLDSEIFKNKFFEERVKVTDKFIPLLKNYKELETILQVFEGQLTLKENKIELTKILNGDNNEEKMKFEIEVQNVDKDTDCLKFRLLEGDTFAFMEGINHFDEKYCE